MVQVYGLLFSQHLLFDNIGPISQNTGLTHEQHLLLPSNEMFLPGEEAIRHDEEYPYMNVPHVHTPRCERILFFRSCVLNPHIIRCGCLAG